MSPSHRALLLSSILFTSPGCCTLAELWCGPDQSEWVQVDFDTPDATIKTFREAFRRRALREIKNCLSEQCKRDTQLVGAMEVGLAWEHFEADNPGIHLLGNAEISSPQANPDGTITYILERSGYQFEVTLIRQAYWEVLYYKDKDHPTPHLAGYYISDAELQGLLKVRSEKLIEDGEVMGYEHAVSGESPQTNEIHRDTLSTKDLHRVAFGRNWKVAKFGLVQPETD